MKIWARIIKENHTVKDTVIEKNQSELTRTKKILTSLEEVCHDWDLAVPIWLDSTITDFQRRSKCRFYSDCFTESIDFDYLELQVLEE